MPVHSLIDFNSCDKKLSWTTIESRVNLTENITSRLISPINSKNLDSSNKISLLK